MLTGQDIHMHKTRGRDNYRAGRHRTVVYEHLPSQAGVNFLNRLPNLIKNAFTPKSLKTRIKRILLVTTLRPERRDKSPAQPSHHAARRGSAQLVVARYRVLTLDSENDSRNTIERCGGPVSHDGARAAPTLPPHITRGNRPHPSITADNVCLKLSQPNNPWRTIRSVSRIKNRGSQECSHSPGRWRSTSAIVGANMCVVSRPSWGDF
ncbi:hypothetical protein J6590_032789 [Homalodisca vitripennis]|nr:hypothetical protein J6590_032789 [Homalodisca vitripennis]